MTGIVAVIVDASRGVITVVIAGVVGRWLAWLLCYVGGAIVGSVVFCCCSVCALDLNSVAPVLVLVLWWSWCWC